MQPIEPSDVPSLDVVEAELNRSEDSYRDRANSIDTKAGLLLSAAGVLVALVGTSPAVAGLIGQIAALVSGGFAVGALYPRVDKSVGPAQLRDRYLRLDPTITRLVLLNTRIDLYAADEHRLIIKGRRVKLAAAFLFAAALAIVIGAMVNVL